VSSAAAPEVTDGWDAVLGQERAVALLQAAAAEPLHAYLLVGPRGSGKHAAALAFAGDVLASAPGTTDPERARRLALMEQHPDLEVLKPEKARMSADEAREIVRLTTRSPVEADRKVIVLPDFHLVEQWGSMLLKSIEEPPPSTVFVILAEDVPPEVVTVASRCVRVDLGPVPEVLIRDQLVREGVAADLADDAAAGATGDLRRARDLATDEGLAARRDAWASVADRLDGTGATVATLVDELLQLIEASAEPVQRRQATELRELDERADRYGEKVRRKPLEDAHKRELRQIRTAELRFGLATLARRYAARLAGDRPLEAVEALGAIQAAGEALIRNPNEPLLLQHLFLRLPAS
jgi:DNA polymerase-3 subunit delta'